MQSIHLRKYLLAKKMDARVKPAHDWLHNLLSWHLCACAGTTAVYGSRAMPIDRQATFSGTKEAAAALAIDAARLQAYLQSRLPDFSGPLAVRQFKGGQSNPTYLLATPARRYVLRRKPPGKLLPSAHAVDREYRVIGALHAQGFPVAAPLRYLSLINISEPTRH
jgi:hypothetical protein